MAKEVGVDAKLLNLGRPEAAGITRDQKRERLLKGKEKMPAYEPKLKPEQVEPLLDLSIELAEAIRGKK